MNATLLAQTAYRTQAHTIRTERALEFDAFARVTHRLMMASVRGREDMGSLATAVHDNRRLWTILTTDVADPENPLPQDLRARIFYLAQFSHHHSSKVLYGNASVQPLIDINSAIMRGLGTNRIEP